MIWLSLLLMALPTSEKISPDGGGVLHYHNPDMSVIIGHREHHYPGTFGEGERVWIWSQQTGTLWLDQIVVLPEGQRVSWVGETDDDYILLVDITPPAVDIGVLYLHFPPQEVYRVELPKDPACWFRSADFDQDGDVDQSDFGYFQRQIGMPGAMTFREFETQITGSR